MQRWILVGISAAFLTVAFGAFGAHALKTRLDEYSMSVFKTATEYLMFHSLALIGLGIWGGLPESQPVTRWINLSGGLFSGGILLFSGSLYALAVSGVRQLGMITPLGGLSFLIGWLSWGWAAFQASRSR